MPNQVLVAVFTGWKLERGRLHKFQTFIGKSDLRIGIRDTIAPHSQREIYQNSTLKVPDGSANGAKRDLPSCIFPVH